VTCSLLWVRCLFDLISISDFGGKWPIKWKFSKMSFWIHRRNTELHFVTKFSGNQPLWSSCKVAWFTKQKNLGSAGLSPHFGQNGPIVPKIPWTLSPLDLSTYTKFDPDQLRFAGFTPERLNFRPKKSTQYRLSADNKSVICYNAWLLAAILTTPARFLFYHILCTSTGS